MQVVADMYSKRDFLYRCGAKHGMRSRNDEVYKIVLPHNVIFTYKKFFGGGYLNA
jgi:hypothetical protein